MANHKTPTPEDIGDPRPEDLWIAVGQALTSWERLQGCLTLLLGAIVGSNSVALMHAFGRLLQVNSKLDMLRDAARTALHGRQDILARIVQFLENVNKHNDFRNHCAHGIVSSFSENGTEHGYFLHPDISNGKYVDRKGFPDTLKFKLTAREVRQYTEGFEGLRGEVVALILELSPDS